MPKLSLATLLSCLALAGSVVHAETVSIPDGRGGALTIEVLEPPDFEPSQEVSILVSPGDFYWPGASRRGWLIVHGEPFFGPQRTWQPEVVFAWLRETYEPKHGGFHLAGWSANSAGIFEIAMAHSDEVLSVTGIAGMPGRGAESDLEKLKSIRVQFVVGENDTYWRRGSERWHESMQKLGIQSTLEIIPDGEHVMPELVGAPMFERLNALVEEIAAPE